MIFNFPSSHLFSAEGKMDLRPVVPRVEEGDEQEEDGIIEKATIEVANKSGPKNDQQKTLHNHVLFVLFCLREASPMVAFSSLRH